MVGTSLFHKDKTNAAREISVGSIHFRHPPICLVKADTELRS